MNDETDLPALDDADLEQIRYHTILCCELLAAILVVLFVIAVTI